jgi:hypothetical protein
MAYIGKSIESGTFSVLDTSGNTYNGSNVTFSLGTQVGSPAQLLVSHDGVIQKPGTDYSLATGGTQITFSTAPASGASIFIVEISGAVGGPLDSDLNGTELILDADADTSITADTDDQIDIRIGGSDRFKFDNSGHLSLLTDSGAIKFGADSDVTLTHDPDDGLFFKSAATADDNPVLLTLQTGETDLAANDVIGKISFQAPDEGTGTDAILVSAAIQAVAEGDHSSSSNATRLEFHTGASELATSQMTISSGGIVGIGAGVPGDLGNSLHVKSADSGASVASEADELVVEASGDCGISILSGTGSTGGINFGDSGDNDIGRLVYDQNSNSMRFVVNASEAMRIDSSGHLKINGADNTVGASCAITNDTTETTLEIQNEATSGTHRCVDFRNGDGDIAGSININTSGDAVSFETSSDYRLKENVVDLTGAITRVKNLKPKRFNFKVDTDTTLDGFLAHEAQSVVPEAVSGTKDETETRKNIVVNAKGNVKSCNITEAEWTQGKSIGEFANDTQWFASKEFMVKQGIDQAKLVPLLTAALQEAITKIETLETKVKALEDA